MAWRGVVIQLALIASMLTITLVALFRSSDPALLHLLVGAMCTAFGTAIARARVDGAASGGGGDTLRPPAPPAPRPSPESTRTLKTVLAALAFVLTLSLVVK